MWVIIPIKKLVSSANLICYIKTKFVFSGIFPIRTVKMIRNFSEDKFLGLIGDIKKENPCSIIECTVMTASFY